jgi:hypothetical protein
MEAFVATDQFVSKAKARHESTFLEPEDGALMQANKDRFAELKCNLANNMTKHVDNYPKTIVDTARMLNNYMSVKM